jgi:hypothetical protein
MEVYLLFDPERDLHKIGVSTDAVRRQRQLQTGNGGLLTLVERYTSTRAARIERSLHRFYQDHQCLGEWFSLPAGEVAGFRARCLFFEQFHQAQDAAHDIEDF